MLKIYRCNICGNLFEVIDDSGVAPVCCGEEMELLIHGTSDGAKEKHVPVYTEQSLPSDDCRLPSGCKLISVLVGEIPHPMIEPHSIEWILVLTDHGVYRQMLSPGQAPNADFFLPQDEKVLAVYSYCNLHGLWVKLPK